MRYWFEAVSYAMKTGDTAQIDSVAHKACGACRNLRSSVDAIYGAKQHVEGGGWRISTITLDPRSKAPSYRFAVEVDQAAQKLMSNSGQTVERTKAMQFVFIAGVIWEDDHFVVYGLEKLA
ncbi:hypothetical protein D4739_09755 [Nocardioides cavernaquae]|uniref:DUF6318 domain-containing protein n=1 Tax=Nocardioides cavernaquae TaxID=2321396 RepID=A0A3A5H717_9ACTN|nr:hypothetical protein D4739_09755 [Nocardioides cavernaquae]